MKYFDYLRDSGKLYEMSDNEVKVTDRGKKYTVAEIKAIYRKQEEKKEKRKELEAVLLEYEIEFQYGEWKPSDSPSLGTPRRKYFRSSTIPFYSVIYKGKEDFRFMGKTCPSTIKSFCYQVLTKKSYERNLFGRNKPSKEILDIANTLEENLAR